MKEVAIKRERQLKEDRAYIGGYAKIKNAEQAQRGTGTLD